MKVTPLLLLLVGSLVAYGQAPPSRPNLSGTWVLDVQKSTLKIPPPSSMTLQIDHSDPQVRFTRTQTYNNQTFDWKLETVAGGEKEVVQKSPFYTTASRVYWQGDSLVIDQKITASDGTTVTDMVTYSLAADGKTLQAVERQATVGGKGSTTNKWVYDKRQ
ncbi:MAG TPA: hypothetical protein VL240_01455 [Candidatus Binatia bacterium]|nr:hypothetical protein [Candidatus Binatia bacterium]